MKIERPSKVEFVLDNLFAVELLIFPYIILVFRKPTWTSMNGSVIITVLCSIAALICCIIVSLPTRRGKREICLNMLTVIGVTALVLYAEWFPILNSIILLSTTSVIIWAIYRIKIEGATASKRSKRKIICFSRHIIAALSVVIIIAVLGHRVCIFKEIYEEKSRVTIPIERHRIEYVYGEYYV